MTRSTNETQTKRGAVSEDREVFPLNVCSKNPAQSKPLCDPALNPGLLTTPPQWDIFELINKKIFIDRLTLTFSSSYLCLGLTQWVRCKHICFSIFCLFLHIFHCILLTDISLWSSTLMNERTFPHGPNDSVRNRTYLSPTPGCSRLSLQWLHLRFLQRSRTAQTWASLVSVTGAGTQTCCFSLPARAAELISRQLLSWSALNLTASWYQNNIWKTSLVF